MADAEDLKSLTSMLAIPLPLWQSAYNKSDTKTYSPVVLVVLEKIGQKLGKHTQRTFDNFPTAKKGAVRATLLLAIRVQSESESLLAILSELIIWV